MKSVFTRILQIFATVYAVIYFKDFALPILLGDYFGDAMENISVFIMFLIFIVALVFSWKKPKTGGFLFIIWFIGIAILTFTLWTDAALALLLSVPMLIVGILLFILGFKNKSNEKST